MYQMYKISHKISNFCKLSLFLCAKDAIFAIDHNVIIYIVFRLFQNYEIAINAHFHQCKLILISF